VVRYKIGTDKNGNKVVKISSPDFQGFSIQTNGNLPKTHRSNVPDVIEIIEWIKVNGTLRQKSLFDGSVIQEKFRIPLNKSALCLEGIEKEGYYLSRIQRGFDGVATLTYRKLNS
jgi:hypothetical protein